MSGELFFTGLALFALGFAGAIIRRSLLSALMGGVLAFVGAALVYSHYALVRQDPAGLARAVILLELCGCLAITGAGLAIAIYRRRGTVNLDELRELSG